MKFNKAVVVVIIAAGIGFSYIYSVTNQEVSSPTPASPQDRISQKVVATAQPQIEQTSQVPEDLNNANESIVSDPDPITAERLQVWLQSSFLEHEKYIIRHRLADIDGDQLLVALQQSYDAGINAGESVYGQEPGGGDITFQLFPDAQYQIAIDKFSVDRNGFTTARGRVVNVGGARTRVRFLVSPDRVVRGTIMAPGNVYNLHATPEYPIYVITEFDDKEASKNMALH